MSKLVFSETIVKSIHIHYPKNFFVMPVLQVNHVGRHARRVNSGHRKDA